MKLDIGCGSNKHAGFYGIDRLPLEDVDLIWDLNESLPIPDHSVEWVMASRVLPYVNNIFAVLEDLYRVSVHKAILCILAPYAHHFRHISNPSLRHKFDEHTPRYLTRHFHQPSQGPACPEVPFYSATEPVFDFRLLRMELFFDAAFRSPLYEQDELEELVALQANVVDEIMYHFVVVKEEISELELEELSRQAYLEPKGVNSLRKVAEGLPTVVEEELTLLTELELPPPSPSSGKKPAGRGVRKKTPRMARPHKKRSRYSP